MNRARPYLKAAAVVSTVALMGAFVAYRAGAFPNPFPADAQPQPEAPPAATPQTASEPPAPDAGHSAFMYGSKSAPAFAPAQPTPVPGTTPAQQPTPTLEGKPPTFMGGSKFITIVSPTGGPPPQPPAPKP